LTFVKPHPAPAAQSASCARRVVAGAFVIALGVAIEIAGIALERRR
jgi:hypothetical protein